MDHVENLILHLLLAQLLECALASNFSLNKLLMHGGLEQAKPPRSYSGSNEVIVVSQLSDFHATAVFAYE